MVNETDGNPGIISRYNREDNKRRNGAQQADSKELRTQVGCYPEQPRPQETKTNTLTGEGEAKHASAPR